jgi:hypothetical protein
MAGRTLLAGFLALCWLAAVRFRELPGVVRRRPQLALHAVFAAPLLASCMPSG